LGRLRQREGRALHSAPPARRERERGRLRARTRCPPRPERVLGRIPHETGLQAEHRARSRGRDLARGVPARARGRDPFATRLDRSPGRRGDPAPRGVRARVRGPVLLWHPGDGEATVGEDGPRRPWRRFPGPCDAAVWARIVRPGPRRPTRGMAALGRARADARGRPRERNVDARLRSSVDDHPARSRSRRARRDLGVHPRGPPRGTRGLLCQRGAGLVAAPRPSSGGPSR
jgi:hypothetical protein